MPVPISYGSTTTVVGDPLLRHGSPPAGDEMSVLLADSDVIPSDFDAKDGGTPVFRDVPFAILFWIHLAVMFWMGESVAPQGYQELAKVNVTEAIEEEIRKNDDDAITVQTLSDAESFVWQVEVFVRVYGVRLLLYLVLPITIFAFLSAFLLMTVIIKPYTRLFVYSTLIGSIAIASLFLISTAVASNTLPMYAIAGVSLLGVFYYVALAWRMVPFAAVNLKVALTGINKNWGLYIIALLFSVVAEVWGNYWVYVAFGVFAQSASQCPADDDDCGPSFWILVGLLFSMFWTSTVIINSVQVSVAGVMATWCFAVVSVLRFIVDNARSRRDSLERGDACGSFLFCVLDCMIQWLDEVVEYFNQWAYCFVAIYGLSYLDSGRKVVELFRARGWSTIVTDKLVGYATAFTSCSVGFVSGLMGMLIERQIQSNGDTDESFLFGDLPGPYAWAFVISFLIGRWVASILMNVINGAVNTLLVCWADSPAKMEYEHPELTAEMANAWNSVFPDANVHVLASFPARN